MNNRHDSRQDARPGSHARQLTASYGRVAVRQHYGAIVALPILTLIGAWYVHDRVASLWLGAWVVTMFLGTGLRALAWRGHDPSGGRLVGTRGRMNAIGVIITALAIGAGTCHVILALPVDYVVLAIMLVAGVASSAVLALANQPTLMGIYSVCILLPPTVAMLFSDLPRRELLAMMGLLFLGFIFLTVRRSAATTARFLSEGLDAATLADSLAETNQLLAQEVAERQRAEHRIVESEQRLRDLFENVQDLIWRIDMDGTISNMSPSVEQLLGLQPDEVIGRNISEFLVGDDTLIKMLEALGENDGRVTFFDHQVRRKDGSAIWLSANISVDLDQDGRPVGFEGTSRDISERRRAMEALSRAEQNARVTLESISDGVITTDTLGIIDYINPVAAQLIGWDAPDARGERLGRVLHLIEGVERRRPPDPVKLCLSKAEPVAIPGSLKVVSTHSGKEASVEVTASPMRDPTGEVIGVVLVLHDVTKVHDMARRLTYQATHDSLTGLINRAEFERRVNEALTLAESDNSQHAICYIDLDQFKVVNDTCGHIAGDELLRELSGRLQLIVRHADTLARLGGDEFGVLLQHCPMDRAREIAESLREVVRVTRFVWDDHVFEIGASIGLVPIDRDSGGLSEILRAADSACYIAKEQGRNRVHLFDPADSEVAIRHGEMRWIQRIQRAWENDAFALYVQPIQALNDTPEQLIIGEVLLRLRDDDGNYVQPEVFLPAAERYHLMPKIDRWVVRAAIRAISTGVSTLNGNGVVAINLSGQSLSDEDFLTFVIECLDECNLSPNNLCFEITETAVIANLSRATRFISILRGMGCRFALDDFGSGLSSFRYLKNLPVDFLKIDGSFILGMVDDAVDYSMVDSINQVGHLMNIKTIAEFVEDAPTLRAVTDLGVDFAQGYHIGKPIPVIAEPDWKEASESA